LSSLGLGARLRSLPVSRKKVWNPVLMPWQSYGTDWNISGIALFDDECIPLYLCRDAIYHFRFGPPDEVAEPARVISMSNVCFSGPAGWSDLCCRSKIPVANVWRNSSDGLRPGFRRLGSCPHAGGLSNAFGAGRVWRSGLTERCDRADLAGA